MLIGSVNCGQRQANATTRKKPLATIPAERVATRAPVTASSYQ